MSTELPICVLPFVRGALLNVLRDLRQLWLNLRIAHQPLTEIAKQSIGCPDCGVRFSIRRGHTGMDDAITEQISLSPPFSERVRCMFGITVVSKQTTEVVGHSGLERCRVQNLAQLRLPIAVLGTRERARGAAG